MKTCDQVAERVALGEELGDLAEHAAECPHCKRLIALPVELSMLKRDADPGMGFASRMTAGAQHRLTVRRHQRYAAGAGLAVAAAAAVGLLVMRQPEEPSIAYVPHDVIDKIAKQAMEPPVAHEPDPWRTHEPGEVDDDVRTLVRMANIDRHRHISAHWGRIEKSLAPYNAVLKGTEP
jgi:hypothetical protein